MERNRQAQRGPDASGRSGKDQAGNLHAVAASQKTFNHWTWDGRTWSAEPIYTPGIAPWRQSRSPQSPWDRMAGCTPCGWHNTKGIQDRANPPQPRPHWISYSRRTASGWTPPRPIFEPINDDNPLDPGVVVLPDGLVVVVIGDVRLASRSLERRFVTWGMGQAWAEPVRVSPDIKTDPAAPSLALDNQGRVHVFYYDRWPERCFPRDGSTPVSLDDMQVSTWLHVKPKLQ